MNAERINLRWVICFFALFGVCSSNASLAFAFEVQLERPGDREFIRDLADIIDADDEQRIRQMCDSLLTDKATPIIVITINSMGQHGGDGMPIEMFATSLFDQWQIGHAKLGNEEWNTGILLLVSKDDRKARIELGGGWGRRKDRLCRRIMDEQIIYHFKLGQFSDGILAGVNSLDKMARELRLPSKPRPWWHYATVLAAIGLTIFTIVSLIRNGSGGWAWVFWGVVFSTIGTVLYHLATSNGGSGGSYGGGSYGGGSSGGGGASGSW